MNSQIDKNVQKLLDSHQKFMQIGMVGTIPALVAT